MPEGDRPHADGVGEATAPAPPEESNGGSAPAASVDGGVWIAWMKPSCESYPRATEIGRRIGRPPRSLRMKPSLLAPSITTAARSRRNRTRAPVPESVSAAAIGPSSTRVPTRRGTA